MRAAEPFDLEALFAPINTERHVAVAVSGGSDSMALLHLAANWALARGVVVTALVFDHGLRAESFSEAKQVQAWCKSLNVACDVLHWRGEKPAQGIQAAARRARYDAMSARCAAIGATVLLTGHTENDQAETVAMRRLRTDSDLSLAGIWFEAKWNGLRLVRPVLGIRRAALRDFLRVRNISWIEDPSNENDKFERVRVRKSLTEGNVTMLSAVAAASFEKVQGALGVIDVWSRGVTRDAYGVVRFPKASFLALDPLARALALRRAFVLFGAGAKVEKSELERLIRWMEEGAREPRALGGVIFHARAMKIEMMREVSRISAETPVGDAPVWWDGRFLVDAPKGSLIVPCLQRNGIPRHRDIAALVQLALPCVLMADGSVCVPHLGLGTGAKLVSVNQDETS